MIRDEFEKLIRSIGFKYDTIGCYYIYKEFVLYLYDNNYDLHTGNYWISGPNDLNNLTPIQEYFKKKLRSIKLKQILK